MYINYKMLIGEGYSLNQYHILQCIFQKESALVLMGEPISRAKEFGDLITFIGKAESWETVRVSKKGRLFLEKLHTYGYTPEIGELKKSLVDLYKGMGRIVDNESKVEENLIWFIGATKFGNNAVLGAVEEYLHNTDSKYTKELSNLIHKAENIFTVKPQLKKSKLFDLVCKKYNLNQGIYLNPPNKATQYIWDIARLKPSGKQLLTGSLKGDKEMVESFRLIVKRMMKL